MKQKTINIYQYDELSETAKEKARDWYRDGMEFAWNSDSFASIQAFINHFGADLANYSIGPYSPLDFKINFDNANFRSLKLKDFSRDFMPTGYCLDCTLWQTFHDEWKHTKSAKLAFETAVYEGFKDLRSDMEWQLSDEAIEENIIANEYEFLESGKRA